MAGPDPVEAAEETVIEEIAATMTGEDTTTTEEETTIAQDPTTVTDTAVTTEIEAAHALVHRQGEGARPATTTTKVTLHLNTILQEGQGLEVGPEVRQEDVHVAVFRAVEARLLRGEGIAQKRPRMVQKVGKGICKMHPASYQTYLTAGPRKIVG